MAQREEQTTLPTLEEIVATLQAYLPELRERFHVKSLGVFGSYVRGEQRTESDVDVLYEYDDVPTLFEIVRLEQRLTEILGVKVDVALRTALKPKIGKRVLAEVVPV